jgi:hypothetical protein
MYGQGDSLFGWLVADGWCWFVLREEYCWLVAGGWFVLREKYCWLVADKPSEHGEDDSILEVQLSLVNCNVWQCLSHHFFQESQLTLIYPRRYVINFHLITKIDHLFAHVSQILCSS